MFIGIFVKRNGQNTVKKWYAHAPGKAVENEEIKVLQDINIQCDNLIETKRADLIVIDKKEQKGMIIGVAVLADVRVEKKEKEKVEKYQDLKKEIRRLWKLRNVKIVGNVKTRVFVSLWSFIMTRLTEEMAFIIL